MLDTRSGAITRHAPPAERCRLAALGAARLLWECDWRGPPHMAWIEHLPSRSVRAFRVNENARYLAIGRHWVRGVFQDNHVFGVSGWIHTTTSEHRTWTNDADAIEDLDEPGLYRPLCTPLERDPDPHHENDTQVRGDPFLPYAYERPWGLRQNGGLLGLDRCGRAETVRLDTKARAGQLLGGWITWSRGVRVNAFFPARGVRRSWRFEQRDPATEATIVAAHTRKHVFVATVPRSGASPTRIFVARVRD